MSQYLDMVEVPSAEGNPWAQMAQQQQGYVNQANTAAAGIPEQQQNLAGQYAALNQYGQSTAPPSYPAMANDFGLGAQEKAPTGASTDRGNPWMLHGDAAAR